ncbi:MAG: TasA family protein [Eubacteriales bacterium]|nr:TasA family protein [Eubacteriales bacterium]
MKRRLFAAAVLVLCLSLLAGGTLAYFTAEDTARNVITTGDISIRLQEWADAEKTTPFPQGGVSGVMPGTEVTKIVEVKNAGANEAYVRVKVDKSLTLAKGVEGKPDLGLLVIDFADDNWTAKDGFYYYNKPLKPGAVTEPLFASVSFDASMGNIYQNSTASVDVKAYAVQVANNGSSPLEAKGWPEP